jgi:hypothetical protein
VTLLKLDTSGKAIEMSQERWFALKIKYLPIAASVAC